MIRRAPKTGYYLNHVARQLALVGRRVKLPAAIGSWMRVAGGEQPPWRVTEMLAAMFPELAAAKLPFVALLSDGDVAAFEAELEAAGLLKGQVPGTG
jgi:hypothetical protein